MTDWLPALYAESHPGGGNDIYGTGGPLYATYVHDKRIFASGEVSWTVTGTNSNYRLGVEPRISDDITQFGFDVRGDKRI